MLENLIHSKESGMSRWAMPTMYILVGFWMMVATSINSFAQCDFLPSTPIALSYTGGNNTPSFTNVYALTNNVGTILEINISAPSFSQRPVGDYIAYNINYETNGGIQNFNVGSKINLVSGACLKLSAPITIKVCNAPGQICDLDINQSISASASGGNSTSEFTNRFALTSSSGVILEINNTNPSFGGKPQGTYLVYNINYETVDGISGLSIGQNIANVTSSTLGGCFKVSAPLMYSVCSSDSDGDGVDDTQELLDGTNPSDGCSYNVTEQVYASTTTTWRALDCDNDGIDNGDEVDPDGNGTQGPNGTNPLDNDSDDDGLTDGEETTGINDPSTPANPGGMMTNPNNADSDGDGVSDGNERTSTGPSDPLTLAGDGCSYNEAEQVYASTSTTWRALDCDNDGIYNGDEVDPDGNGTPGPNGTNPLDNDSDDDGLTDGEETTGINDPSTPANPGGMMTNPNNADSDGDGVSDGNERTSTGPSDPLTLAGDGCSYNAAEQLYAITSTTWRALDCDNDGIDNGDEVDPDGNGAAGPDGTNPLDNDSDDDGLTDGEETTGVDDPSTPANPGGMMTNPNNADTDGDGVDDGDERTSTGPSDPLTIAGDGCSYNAAEQVYTSTSTTWRALDCDNDSIDNGDEVDPDGNGTEGPDGTNPLDNDTDDDGFLDGDDDCPNVPGIAPNGCPANLSCVMPDLKILLEGPVVQNGNTGIMSTEYNEYGYLPGQKPTTFFGHETPAGQPYNVTPWNYNGVEGSSFVYTPGQPSTYKAGYPINTTDWVLVSLRTDQDKASTVCTRAALLLNDGTVQMVSGNDCCDIDINQTYYVVIEHYNHLLVMSPTKLPVVEGKILFDFTTTQSFLGLIGFGQKIINGKYVMHAANGQQANSTNADTDINVADQIFWLNDNGVNSGYYRNDYDANGDVNVIDKVLWNINNGKFSDVPRN